MVLFMNPHEAIDMRLEIYAGGETKDGDDDGVSDGGGGAGGTSNDDAERSPRSPRGKVDGPPHATFSF